MAAKKKRRRNMGKDPRFDSTRQSLGTPLYETQADFEKRMRAKKRGARKSRKPAGSSVQAQLDDIKKALGTLKRAAKKNPRRHFPKTAAGRPAKTRTFTITTVDGKGKERTQRFRGTRDQATTRAIKASLKTAKVILDDGKR